MEADPKSQGSAFSLEILVEAPESGDQSELDRLRTEAEDAVVAAAVAEVAAAEAERRLQEQAEIVRRERERALLARERATQALKVVAQASGEQPESGRTQREAPAAPVAPEQPAGPSARSRGRFLEWGGIAGGALVGLAATLIMRLLVEGSGQEERIPPEGAGLSQVAVHAAVSAAAEPAPSAGPAPSAPPRHREPAGPPIPPLRTREDRPQHVRRTHLTGKRHRSRHHRHGPGERQGSAP